SASGLPAGLSINSSTGLIAGTVSAAAVSTNVAVTVQDGRGGTGTVTFMWTVTQPPPPPPAAPGGLLATADSSSQIKLTWADNSTDETKFVIQRTSGTGSLFIDVVSPPVPNSTGTVSYVDTAVARNTSYKYVVSACNANGCSNASNSSSTKTKPH